MSYPQELRALEREYRASFMNHLWPNRHRKNMRGTVRVGLHTLRDLRFQALSAEYHEEQEEAECGTVPAWFAEEYR